MSESDKLILELRHTIAELSGTIASMHAELEGQVDPLCYTQRELIELQYQRHYEANNGNCTATAQSLGISRKGSSLLRNQIGLPAYDKWGRIKNGA